MLNFSYIPHICNIQHGSSFAWTQCAPSHRDPTNESESYRSESCIVQTGTKESIHHQNALVIENGFKNHLFVEVYKGRNDNNIYMFV